MVHLHASGDPLSRDELAHFHAFKSALQEQSRCGHVLVLYRGDERRQMRRMLARPGDQITEPELYDRLFLFGAKARHFFVDEPWQIDRRAYLQTINDAGEETFAHLFDRIANVLSDERTAIHARQNCSREFRAYFDNDQSRLQFYTAIRRAPDELRLRIRDYYLYFLHTAGSAGIRDETFLVSTSTQERVARYFASRARTKIIEYFVPRPYENFVVAPWLCTDIHEKVYEAGLPTFQPFGIFPGQREVAVKGGLLPHFIVSVRDFRLNSVVPNPHLLTTMGQSFQEMLSQGIPVDQSQFEATVFSTGYHRYHATNRDGMFTEFVVPTITE